MIEALIAIVILSITAMTSASLFSQMSAQNMQSNRNLGRQTFEQELVGLFRSSDLCSCNLGSTAPITIPAVGSVRVNNLRKSCASAVNDFYVYNATSGYEVEKRLVVSDITISNPQNISGNSFSAELQINYQPIPSSLKNGRYLILFEKTAAAGPPYVISTCNVAGALTGPSAGWRLGGNSGTDSTIDYFGTSDNVDVIFRRNNLLAGALRVDETAWGVGALIGNTTGERNVALGTSALSRNTTGVDNTAIGWRAGIANVTGSQNIFVGGKSNSAVPGFNASGSGNIAIGYDTLLNNDSGAGNVAIGTLALTSFNVMGSTAVGHRAMELSNSSDSVAIGRDSLRSGVADRNIGIGMSAGSNLSGADNVTIGFQAGANLVGNNVMIGSGAGESVGGSNNVGIGFQAFRSANGSTMIETVAVGAFALTANSSGAANTAVGFRSLASNTSGNNNTSIGHNSLGSNTTGSVNSAFGSLSLFQNTTGNSNTAYGNSTLRDNTTGSGNSAFGASVLLQNSIGVGNVGFGRAALSINTAGNNNVGIGTSALEQNVTGSLNTAVGFQAGITPAPGMAAGMNNVFIGANTGPQQGFGTISNAIAIGSNAKVNASNNMILGGTGSDAVNVGIGLTSAVFQLQLSTDSAAKPGTMTWTVASDERLKNVRAPFIRGLDALELLNPIYYHYKHNNELGLPSDKEYVGVIAQEARKAVPESVKETRNGFLHLQTDSIIWTMVNSIKELYRRWKNDSHDLHNKISKLEKENQSLIIQNQSILLRLEKLEKRKDKE